MSQSAGIVGRHARASLFRCVGQQKLHATIGAIGVLMSLDVCVRAGHGAAHLALASLARCGTCGGEQQCAGREVEQMRDGSPEVQLWLRQPGRA